MKKIKKRIGTDKGTNTRRDPPSTALAIPPERLKTESDLRSEINKLEGEYEILKKNLDAIASCVNSLDGEFREKLDAIAAHEAKLLDSLFPNRSGKLEEWLLSEGELKPSEKTSRLHPRDREECRKLLCRISKAAHPDWDKTGKYSDLIKEATAAYERGDLDTLKRIAMEVEQGNTNYSQRLLSTIEELEKERSILAFLVADQKRTVKGMEFAGVKLANFLQNGILDTKGIVQAVGAAIDAKLAEIGYTPPKSEEQSVELSDETALVKPAQEKGLRAFSEEEKERIIKGRAERILLRVDRISPYYKGLDGSSIGLAIRENESRFSPTIHLGYESLSVVKRDMEVPKGACACIDIGGFGIGGFCHFFLSLEGKVTVPRKALENFSSYARILSKVENILSQPLRNLSVFLHKPVQIVGCYEEHTDSRSLSEEYLLDTSNEIMINRLVRAMVLLKIPRRYEYEEYIERYLFSEELQESFRYDFNDGRKKGDKAEMVVEIEGEKLTVLGEIFEMENRSEIFGGFRKLMPCNYVEFEGYIEKDGHDLQFRMTFESSRAIHAFMDSIKRPYEDFEIFLTIGDRDVYVSYENRRGSTPTLKVEGMPEELLPELVFRIIETLRVERVFGEASGKYSFEYM